MELRFAVPRKCARQLKNTGCKLYCILNGTHKAQDDLHHGEDKIWTALKQLPRYRKNTGIQCAQLR